MYFSGANCSSCPRSTSGVLLNEKLAKKDYQESTSTSTARRWPARVSSSKTSGRRAEGRSRGGDRVRLRRPGGKRTVFDDTWRKEQKLTDEQYAKLFSDADALYSRLLQALINQAKR